MNWGAGNLPRAGDTMTWTRTFTDADIDAFIAASGDVGEHHVAAAPGQRRMVHGLLTATLPTKVGGDLNYIAGDMHFRFFRPVFSGDTIDIHFTIESISMELDRQRIPVTISWVCVRSGDEKTVMDGHSSGFLPAP